MTTGEGYAHPEFLVEPEWVEAHREAPGVVVVDTDVEAGYLRGHVAGAVLMPDNYQKDPETGRVHILPPDGFANLCQRLGIGDDSLVIAYDNNQSLYAARFWWALNYYGHSNVKVMNGGWRSWVQEGRPVSFDRAAPRSGAAFTPRADASLIVKGDELKDACQLSDTVVWDVRSDGEYDGSNSRGNQRIGHIPSAIHLEWFNVMDRETHRFKPAAEVRALLEAKGITPDKAVYAY